MQITELSNTTRPRRMRSIVGRWCSRNAQAIRSFLKHSAFKFGHVSGSKTKQRLQIVLFTLLRRHQAESFALLCMTWCLAKFGCALVRATAHPFCRPSFESNPRTLGQSNMVFPLEFDYNATAEIGAADLRAPRLRFMDLGTQWQNVVDSPAPVSYL